MTEFKRPAPKTQPPPAAIATLLSRQICSMDHEAGVLLANYTAPETFANPAGTVQGGMLCSMLDDIMAVAVDLTRPIGENIVTLNMNVSFLSGAQPGPLQGTARIVRQGKTIAHVSAELAQNGRAVAAGTATCQVLPAPRPAG